MAELAALAGLSISQLSRSFRRGYGTTPYAFVLAVRVEHGKALLQGGMGIADAAFTAGFADQSHFTRHFRRVTGVTPRAFSRSAHGARTASPRKLPPPDIDPRSTARA